MISDVYIITSPPSCLGCLSALYPALPGIGSSPRPGSLDKIWVDEWTDDDIMFFFESDSDWHCGLEEVFGKHLEGRSLDSARRHSPRAHRKAFSWSFHGDNRVNIPHDPQSLSRFGQSGSSCYLGRSSSVKSSRIAEINIIYGVSHQSSSTLLHQMCEVKSRLVTRQRVWWSELKSVA